MNNSKSKKWEVLNWNDFIMDSLTVMLENIKLRKTPLFSTWYEITDLDISLINENKKDEKYKSIIKEILTQLLS